MYFPYLRGRQFELIAIRELIEHKLISNKIIPVIEPVRASSTLLKTLTSCLENKQPVAFIINPKVGTYLKELSSFAKNKELTDIIKYQEIIKTYIVDEALPEREFSIYNTNINNMIFIHDKVDYIETYNTFIGNNEPLYNFMPDERDFRRAIRKNKVSLCDSFAAKERNSDYSDTAEIFSNDHLFYKDDGYLGFSDYSIIGNKFSEAGFAPYCLVIHIVYLDDNKRLMIRHFKSKSNEDARDPANKFQEAMQEFIKWNEVHNLKTFAVNQLLELYNKGIYPGLGTIKKLSVMHHIEIINSFLSI